jgi:exopolyphosphatase/guanosine-5'-triphosphate,3'-diphosphate pyrophosphatase
MKPLRRAVIDVGTNSIKLLIVELDGRDIKPLREESNQTRLGRGFYPNRILQPEPIAQTAEAITEFAATAAELGAGRPRIVATSAVREAVNQQELSVAVERASGLNIRVISGEEEANYAFRGVTSDPRLAQQPLLLLDIGGGSAEFIVGRRGQKSFAGSFPLGTVRLLERLQPADCPGMEQLALCRNWLREFFGEEISPKLLPALREAADVCAQAQKLLLVGTGGTASILACMEAGLTAFDRQKVEETLLSQDRLRWHVENLWGLPMSQRKRVVGLPPNRSDVILTGSAIYEAVMGSYNFQQLRVSTRGLRFAIATEEDSRMVSDDRST